MIVVVALGIAAAIAGGIRWAGRHQDSVAPELRRADAGVSRSSPEFGRLQLEQPPAPTSPQPLPVEPPPVEPATEAPRVEAAATAPEWVQEILRSSPESWPTTHEGWSRWRLEEKQARLQKYIADASLDEFQRRIANREWTATSNERRFEGKDWDPTAVMQVVMPPGEGTYTIKLPKEQFPDLYALQAQVAWLSDAIGSAK